MGGCHLRLPFDLCDHCISKDEEARLFLQISRAEGGRVSIAIEDDDNVDISSRCHITCGAGFSCNRYDATSNLSWQSASIASDPTFKLARISLLIILRSTVGVRDQYAPYETRI